MKADCPCRTCDKKGCGTYHSDCEQYLRWKKELEEVKKARDKALSYRDKNKYKYEKPRR